MPNLAKWDESQPRNSQKIPCLGLVSLCQIWDFYWVFFKYPKISKNGNPLFFPVTVANLHCQLSYLKVLYASLKRFCPWSGEMTAFWECACKLSRTVCLTLSSRAWVPPANLFCLCPTFCGAHMQKKLFTARSPLLGASNSHNKPM